MGPMIKGQVGAIWSQTSGSLASEVTTKPAGLRCISSSGVGNEGEEGEGGGAVQVGQS